MPASYLLPISDVDALRWIVQENRTAFAKRRANEAARLREGDVLFLYATRRGFRTLTGDRGRVFGRAIVKRPAVPLKDPVRFGRREFPHLVELSIESLAPLREGIELAPLVPRLRETFPDPETWTARMRRALVPIAVADARVVERELTRVAQPYADLVSTYAVPLSGSQAKAQKE